MPVFACFLLALLGAATTDSNHYHDGVPSIYYYLIFVPSYNYTVDEALAELDSDDEGAGGEGATTSNKKGEDDHDDSASMTHNKVVDDTEAQAEATERKAFDEHQKYCQGVELEYQKLFKYLDEPIPDVIREDENEKYTALRQMKRERSKLINEHMDRLEKLILKKKK